MKHSGRTLVEFLYREQLEVFRVEDLEVFLGKLEPGTYVMLEELVKRGSLTKLKQGLYACNPPGRRGEAFMPNWHKVAAAWLQPRPYYIGYYSALQAHNLITQPSLKEYIISPQRVQPKEVIMQGVPFEVIYLKLERFFGYQKTWINNHDKVYCSDIEKTIIDCLDKPQHAGGLEGIVKALDMAASKINPPKLLEYAERFHVQAVMKRLGFILEAMGLFPDIQGKLHTHITESYTPLDPSIKLKGRFHRRWRIEDNIEISDILQTIHT
ncbi:MAG: type IV toxin-antitoxin system AbiEi family antitoxin [Bacteroidia bacterium]|nr:type IV toxin-antitoxin system AbiEi family antitoxin [Bacteroidia bacterium]